ncbi:methyltransferase-like protein 1 [Quillaja saponaria]|uniref:Methyltransferase-like protein 1 n=1 Tax=Quillaja saponaria TaxID=32244 RepID=A0AAD7M777_QUISA|nr:methyltransferase-like protein 1 [Quillaja saponaria]
MDSPERSKSYWKRDIEGSSDVKSDRVGDDEEWGASDKKKHRSSRSRKSGNGEDTEGSDGSGRKRNSGERNEIRKRAGGSGRANSDDNDYDSRKESRSKQMKKKQEESTLEKLSSWYQDGELESRNDGRDKLANRGPSRADESDKKKITSKVSEHDISQKRSKSKERSYDLELDKMDKDYRHSEKRESSREKGHGSAEQVRSSRRKWDEPDDFKKAEESIAERVDFGSGRASDSRNESARERSVYAKNELGDTKTRTDSYSDKGVKTNSEELRRADPERSKSKGMSESLEISCEDRLERGKTEKHRHQKTPTSFDFAESWDRPSNADEHGNTRMKDKSVREIGQPNRSRTPERSGRHHEDSEHPEMDYEKGSSLKRKEIEKDVYRDDRTKGKDDTWSDRNKDQESKESWKRRQTGNTDKESKNVDLVFGHGREWDLPRHGRDRIDNERPHGRPGNRKDGNRGEAVKTSSNFGISNENYDVIEIQTKPMDYGRTESISNFSRRTEVNLQSDVKSVSNEDEWAYVQEDKVRKTDLYGSTTPGEDLKERYTDDMRDQNSWRDDNDFHGGKGRGQKGAMPGRSTSGQSSSSGSQLQYGNQESGSFNRAGLLGVKGSRVGRGGRGRHNGRDSQHVGIPLPIIGSPFGPLSMAPPGSMQPLTPNMSPAPGPPISPGVFVPPFTPPVWPGTRGVDMNMLGVPPALSPVPLGLSPRFPPNMGTPPNPAMYFNQSGPGRGVPPSISSPGFNGAGPMSRGTPPDKTSGGWIPPKSNGPPGKAPSRGEQNDYSQNFVDTGMRPQNFIRELELTNFVEDYPKLRELIQKKDEIVTKSTTPPVYYKCDLKEFELSPEFFGTKFDVILVDPPWEEYVHRAPGAADHMEYWAFEEIMNLKIEAIADTPSFIFLWVGDGVGLEQGRQCLKKWGYRRCEDICWVKTNKNNATPGLRHDSHTLFQHSKEHCLMGIKGTVRRSTDGHIIHANIDTDVVISEETPYGSTQKPEDMYRIIEHFALGRRRLELFGEDHNIRAGWLTVGKGLSSSNFNTEAYIKNFADKDGKVWHGGGGRNPPPEAPHLVLTTPDIEALRPKSPMKNQQQLQQQQSTSISLTAANSSNRRSSGNSPQNPTGFGLNQEAFSSNPSTPAPWASPMEGFKGREGILPSEDNVFDVYGYNSQANYLDFESYTQMNLL